jgi:hypothetical protein
MTDLLHLRLKRSPPGWRSYAGVMLRSRPPVTEVNSPRPITLSVHALRLREGEADRYSRACGFDSRVSLPVTYPHVLAMPLHLRIFSMPEFPLRPMGLIHLTNSIDCSGELRAGQPLDIDVSAQNFRRTDPGLAFDMITEIRGKGVMLWRESCCFLARWPESLERPAGRPQRPPKAPKDAAVLAELPVSLRTAWDYARVSSDYNPIHLNDRAARYFGLRGAIAHGMWSLARTASDFEAEQFNGGCEFSVNFKLPIYMPSWLMLQRWSLENGSGFALRDGQGEKPHLTGTLKSLR